MSEEIKEIPKSQVETGAVDKKAAQKDLEKGRGHRPTPEKLRNDSMINYFYFLRDWFCIIKHLSLLIILDLNWHY